MIFIVMENGKKCDYCNDNIGRYTMKNGKVCCEISYQSCPEIKRKNSEKVTKSLKEQYKNGDRKSHFLIFNNGSFWKDRKHNDDSKKKISEKRLGLKMSDEFKKMRSEEMKTRYSNGWQNTAGRTKKIKYESPIAGVVFLDGTWELKTAKYFDDNNINWFRNTKRFNYVDNNNKKRTYCPDFYLTDEKKYIEVKGYQTKLDEIKWSQFNEPLEVWNGEVLKNKNIL